MRECPKDYYCPAGSTFPEMCEGNLETKARKSKSAADCQKPEEPPMCAAGTFCAGGNVIICPMNYFCPDGSISPNKCPKDTKTENEGAKSASDCVPQPLETSKECGLWYIDKAVPLATYFFDGYNDVMSYYVACPQRKDSGIPIVKTYSHSAGAVNQACSDQKNAYGYLQIYGTDE